MGWNPTGPAPYSTTTKNTMKNFRYKLGKKPVQYDHRTFKLARYLPALPPVPAAIDWSGRVLNWEMLGNDTVGNCTCASAGHCEMLWTSQTGPEYSPADADILAAYSAITGYDPKQTDAAGNNPTDNGADELSVLKYWRNNGIAGHKISSFMSVDVSNLNQVRAAVALFGVLYVGVQMPARAMDETNAGEPWIVGPDTQIEGGHAIPIVAYDADELTCVTWGQLQKMTWEWFQKYCDEGYVVLSQDWINANGSAPSGFNLAQLSQDLKSL